MADYDETYADTIGLADSKSLSDTINSADTISLSDSSGSSPSPYALSFNGSSAIIDFGNIANFSSADSFTFAVWVYFKGAGEDAAGGTIFGKYSTGGYLLYIYDNANGIYWQGDGTGWNTTITVSKNEWHRVVFTHGPTYKTLYVDGNSTPAAQTAITSFSTSSAPFRVGTYYDPATQRFYGDLDELQIYNIEWQGADVITDYEASAGRYGLSGDTGLVSGWHFDDGSPSSTVADYSVSGNTGTITGATWITGEKSLAPASGGTAPKEVGLSKSSTITLAEATSSETGIVKAATISLADDSTNEPGIVRAEAIVMSDGAGSSPYALLFDGFDDVINWGRVTDFEVNSLSVEVWFKPTVLAVNNHLILYETPLGYGEASGWYFLVLSDGRLVIMKGNEAAGGYTWEYAFSTNTLTISNYYHLVGTYDGLANSDSFQLYINGTRETSFSAFSLTSSGIDYGTSPAGNEFKMGMYSGGGFYTAWVDGILDEPRVYPGRVLSQTDVTNHYASGAGWYGTLPDTDLKGGWHFDEGTGIYVTDYSGNSHTGTITGATWVSGEKALGPAGGGGISKEPGLNKSDTIALADSYGRQADFIRTRDEVVSVVDANSNQAGLNESADISIADARSNEPGKNPADVITLFDVPARNCLLFDGIDDIATIPNDSTLYTIGNDSPAVDWTIEFWIKPRISHYGEIVSKGDIGETRPLDMSINGTTITMYQFNNPITNTWNLAGITIGAWNHVVYVIDRGTGCQTYLNGQAVGAVQADNVANCQSSDDLLFGNDIYDHFFDGKLEEFRLYVDRKLTSGEVLASYNCGGGIYGEADTNLEVALHFDEGTGIYAYDYSGNNHTMTLTGTTWAASDICWEHIGILKEIDLNKPEDIYLNDANNKDVVISILPDTIQLADIKSLEPGLNESGVIILSDDSSNQAGLNKSDPIALSDLNNKEIDLTKPEITSIIDSLSKETGLIKIETISLLDASSKELGIISSENIGLVDGLYKEISIIEEDTINLSDIFYVSHGFGRLFTDDIYLAESHTYLVTYGITLMLVGIHL